MTATAPDLLTSLLRDVSRSFYLSLRLLPRPVRSQIGLAYLLARATDTVADTGILPMEERLTALADLRERIQGNRPEPVDFTRLAEKQGSASERALLIRVEEAVACLGTLPSFDRGCIRAVLQTITSGQDLDLRRFHGANANRIVALETATDLDDYTFRVAGCVGEFWTRICRFHLYPNAPMDLGRYLDDAVRFGKGLQLVNILRDIPSDLRQGRCYVPAQDLAEAALKPADLLDPGHMQRFRPIYSRHLRTAAGHLSAGWRYTCETPRKQMRVRLGCALPLLIGAETLRLLESENVLDPSRRVKVTRSRVRSLLFRAVVLHPFPGRWQRLFPDLTGSDLSPRGQGPG